ncbi:putative clathrin assembly protein At5g35200 [Cornus florida]|uniref:putative clathrin assembly protein At5g35200 n=1 Tax=Cornus florida TaxID=4283 RepID=UPI0028A2AE9F|nr:putative clathrin assembly protein At5g35200 [Cornus florida]
MTAAGNAQQSLRKALGALKDSTTLGLAKVNSENKELDVAIVKATNHVEKLAKDKHIRKIFDAVSASRPRADVAYCIHALARRLAKTHNWAVALKTLIVIHRALREVDPTFREELINYSRSRGLILNLSHFKDESSPNAWDYSAWVRNYALYLEECLECFRILKYDVQTDCSRTKELDTLDLIEQLPALQQVLFRLTSCQPEGTARYNYLIQYAFAIVAAESVRIYVSITDGTLNLVDKFFEMQRHDAVRALSIYRRAALQAERLSEFFELCRSLDFGRGQKYIKIEQPPASFLAAMEDYVKDAPQALMLSVNLNAFGLVWLNSLESSYTYDFYFYFYYSVQDQSDTPIYNVRLSLSIDFPILITVMLLCCTKVFPTREQLKVCAQFLLMPRDLCQWFFMFMFHQNDDDRGGSPKAVAASEPDLETDHKQDNDDEEKSDPSVTSRELNAHNEAEATPQPQVTDLLGLDELTQVASELDDKNALALAIFTPENPSNYKNSSTLACQSTGWELALVTAPSSNGAAVSERTLAGGLDRLTLDSLYDNAIASTNQNGDYHTGQMAPNPLEAVHYTQDQFQASSNLAPPTSVQMDVMAQQQEALIVQQQQQSMIGCDPTNLFGNPFVDEGARTNPSHTSYSGLI